MNEIETSQIQKSNSAEQRNAHGKNVGSYDTSYNIGYYYFYDDAEFTGMGYTLLGDYTYDLEID